MVSTTVLVAWPPWRFFSSMPTTLPASDSPPASLVPLCARRLAGFPDLCQVESFVATPLHAPAEPPDGVRSSSNPVAAWVGWCFACLRVEALRLTAATATVTRYTQAYARALESDRVAGWLVIAPSRRVLAGRALLSQVGPRIVAIITRQRIESMTRKPMTRT